MLDYFYVIVNERLTAPPIKLTNVSDKVRKSNMKTFEKYIMIYLYLNTTSAIHIQRFSMGT